MSPPHPHTGLQTVSWLLDGEIHHRDTLGSDAMVVPGQLNLMTSGAGIAHSEESPPGHSPIMHGVQLWVALPDPVRHEAPRDFTQYADLPRLERPGLTATVIIGQLEDVESPATAYSPLVGAELAVSGDARVELRPGYEYGVLAIDDGLVVEGERLAVSEIGYVGAGRDSLSLTTDRRTGSWVAARRRAVRRGAGDVVELHRSLARGDRRVPRAVERRGRPVRARRGV